ncbi:MAG: ribbon-helix-helix domain-containing protein [Alphaproteobacteria bacterium]|nr:ribbon-helix-helix domain-containing protein [Alphaproteobacteria bacterium]
MKKHSVQLSGHATSVCVEDIFWNTLIQLAQEKGISLRQLLIQIDNAHIGNLSSAIRVFVIKELLQKVTQNQNP